MIQSLSDIEDRSMLVIPADHRGPVCLPGTGRMIFWTGRVAIGLRHQPAARPEPTSQSALWIQDLMLAKMVRQGV